MPERTRFFKLSFFVPESHKEQVKEALFAAGAARLGHYDKCSWETKGTGQFRPLPGSDPFLGEPGHVERVDEYKVEMICNARYLAVAIDALKDAHPYETPAFDYWEVGGPGDV